MIVSNSLAKVGQRQTTHQNPLRSQSQGVSRFYSPVKNSENQNLLHGATASCYYSWLFAPIAQWIEHLPPKKGVARSIRAGGANTAYTDEKLRHSGFHGRFMEPACG